VCRIKMSPARCDEWDGATHLKGDEVRNEKCKL